jgi:hypothetical protein
MSKFKLTQSGVLGLVAGALRGWKPKRMKRALKQAKRNFKDGKCFVFDDVADSVQITNEESDEISLHPETVVHENAVEVLPAGDYTGDIAGLIDRMIADGELKDTDKLSHLLKTLAEVWPASGRGCGPNDHWPLQWRRERIVFAESVCGNAR